MYFFCFTPQSLAEIKIHGSCPGSPVTWSEKVQAACCYTGGDMRLGSRVQGEEQAGPVDWEQGRVHVY